MYRIHTTSFLLSAFWGPPTHCGRHISMPPYSRAGKSKLTPSRVPYYRRTSSIGSLSEGESDLESMFRYSTELIYSSLIVQICSQIIEIDCINFAHLWLEAVRDSRNLGQIFFGHPFISMHFCAPGFGKALDSTFATATRQRLSWQLT